MLIPRWVYPKIIILSLLSLLNQAAQADSPVLFFSEYIEGSSHNKALEIFNPSAETVDLRGYDVQIFSNGGAEAWRTIALEGELAAGEVYVLVHKQADDTLRAQADQTSGSVAFNGNDAVALRHDGVLIDVIGQIGHDPGEAWGSGDHQTKDRTLRRKLSVTQGDSDGHDSFDPSEQWDGFGQDSFDDLGRHGHNAPPTEPPPATPTETATLLPTETPSPTNPPTAIPTEPPSATPTETASPLPTETASPTVTPSLTEPPISPTTPPPHETETANAGAVLINEMVTDPQQDWSGSDFNHPPGNGTVSQGVDEWVELYIVVEGLDLSGWQIELLDGTDVRGDLTAGGAFQTVRYIGSGQFERTAAGDYLILGNVAGSEAMNNEGTIRLLDNNGAVIDEVILGQGSAPSGNASGPENEAVARQPNGHDSDNHGADFRSGPATLGRSNTARPPEPTDRPTSSIPEDTPTATPLAETVPPTLTPTPLPSVEPPAPTSIPLMAAADGLPLLISEVLYDGTIPSTEGDEFVELCNPNQTVMSLADYKIGDAEQPGQESMYRLPERMLSPDQCVVIAKNADQFASRFGTLPDFEAVAQRKGYTDNPAVPNLEKYSAWASGNWSLANDGDALILLNPTDRMIDSVAYRNGDYESLGLEAGISAPEPRSLQRVWPYDSNSMPNDFVRTGPTPGQPTKPPLPAPFGPAPVVADGWQVYWGSLHAHTTFSDGAGPPHYALAKARAAGLHFYAISDHGWWLTEAEWARTAQQVEQANQPGQFVVLRGIEWTHREAGHITVFNTESMLNRNQPLFDALSDMYGWLANNPQAIAQFNHPDPTYGGTFHEFAYHAAAARQLYLQEIGNHAQGYVTYEPSFIQSNMQGWRVSPTNNGDTHNALWGTDTPARTGLVARSLTQADLLEAMRARRVFATEDSNLAVTLRANDSWMGTALDTTGPLPLTVQVLDLDIEGFTIQLYDSNMLLEQARFERADIRNSEGVAWTTTVHARPGHFYWVKVVQDDGEIAYSTPIWINGQREAAQVFINEILPAPRYRDWNGDGQANGDDEWVELFNPNPFPVGLGGWQLTDESQVVYHLPLTRTLPAQGFLTLPKTETGFALNNGGDRLTLTHPNGTVSDQFQYDHSPGYDESWCRLPDGGNRWSSDCGPSPNEANWELERNQPLRQDIFTTKRLAYNAWVVVDGRVTAPPGVLGKRLMYIQDRSSGILVYLPKDFRGHFDLGDQVEVEGNLRSFHEEAEIVVRDRSDIKLIEAKAPFPPLPIHTTALLEPYEGYLVMLRGQAVAFDRSNTFWVDDGTDWAKVYIRRSTGIRKPFIEIGTELTLVGIVSQYSDREAPSRNDYRLLLRYPSDLVILPTPEPTAVATETPPLDNWPSVLPETGD